MGGGEGDFFSVIWRLSRKKVTIKIKREKRNKVVQRVTSHRKSDRGFFDALNISIKVCFWKFP